MDWIVPASIRYRSPTPTAAMARMTKVGVGYGVQLAVDGKQLFCDVAKMGVLR
jgi:hypothetical protein